MLSMNINNDGIYVKNETPLLPGKLYINYNGSFGRDSKAIDFQKIKPSEQRDHGKKHILDNGIFNYKMIFGCYLHNLKIHLVGKIGYSLSIYGVSYGNSNGKFSIEVYQKCL